MAAAADFSAARHMCTCVVATVAHFNEGTHREVVRELCTVAEQTRDDIVLDAGARVVAPLAAAGSSEETVALAVVASQNGIDKEIVCCKVRGHGRQ